MDLELICSLLCLFQVRISSLWSSCKDYSKSDCASMQKIKSINIYYFYLNNFLLIICVSSFKLTYMRVLFCVKNYRRCLQLQEVLIKLESENPIIRIYHKIILKEINWVSSHHIPIVLKCQFLPLSWLRYIDNKFTSKIDKKLTN